MKSIAQISNVIHIDSTSLADLIAEGNAKTREIMNKNEDLAKLAREILGYPGAMICGSKSMYGEMYPKNIAVFNSNVVTAKGKIWYGDLDVTLSEKKLAELASKSGETIYVLREMYGRFENEENPKIEYAVYAVSPEGKNSYQDGIKRIVKGRGKGKLVYER